MCHRVLASHSLIVAENVSVISYQNKILTVKAEHSLILNLEVVSQQKIQHDFKNKSIKTSCRNFLI